MPFNEENPKNRCWNLSDIYIDKLWDTDIRIATYILQYVKIFSFKVFWQHYILLVRPLLINGPEATWQPAFDPL